MASSERHLPAATMPRPTYQAPLDKSDGQILLAELALNEAKLQGLDVECILNHAGFVLQNAARFGWDSWSNSVKASQNCWFHQI